MAFFVPWRLLAPVALKFDKCTVGKLIVWLPYRPLPDPVGNGGLPPLRDGTRTFLKDVFSVELYSRDSNKSRDTRG